MNVYDLCVVLGRFCGTFIRSDMRCGCYMPFLLHKNIKQAAHRVGRLASQSGLAPLFSINMFSFFYFNFVCGKFSAYA